LQHVLTGLQRRSHFTGGADLLAIAGLAGNVDRRLVRPATIEEGIHGPCCPARSHLVHARADNAVGAGKSNTLAAALKAAGLVDTLKGAGPFTVFAPTDEAFAKLPTGTVEELLKPENKAKLTAILTYHVVSGKAMAADVSGMSSAKTVNGKSLTLMVTDGKVMIDNATVTPADIDATNGVIHVIDTVLMP
jgi:uncharacterized surface protein with fasciclin (FAS1) repeats